MSRYSDPQREEQFKIDERELCLKCGREIGDDCGCEEDEEELEDLF